MGKVNPLIKWIALTVLALTILVVLYRFIGGSQVEPLSGPSYKSPWESKPPASERGAEFNDQAALFQQLSGDLEDKVGKEELAEIIAQAYERGIQDAKGSTAHQEITTTDPDEKEPESIGDKIRGKIDNAQSKDVTEQPTEKTEPILKEGGFLDEATSALNYFDNRNKAFGIDPEDKTPGLTVQDLVNDKIGLNTGTAKQPEESGKPNGLAKDIFEAETLTADDLDDSGRSTPSDELVWYVPVDRIVSVDDKGNQVIEYPEIVGTTNTSNRISPVPNSNEEKKSSNILDTDPAIPFATLNYGAKFVGAQTLTSLIGLVPIDGEVKNPFQFAVKVGSKNLATNGHTISGLENMEFYGFTSGNYGDSCVRGYITGMTYTFEDGTVQSITTETATDIGDKTQWIGYLTDQWGEGCIKGTVESNIAEYLSYKSVAVGLAAGGRAAAQSQTDTISNIEKGLKETIISGNTYAYMGGEMLAAGANESAELIDKLYGDVEVLIRVPTATKVNVFLTRQLNLDYNPNGRKTNYDYSNISGHFAELD